MRQVPTTHVTGFALRAAGFVCVVVNRPAFTHVSAAEY